MSRLSRLARLVFDLGRPYRRRHVDAILSAIEASGRAITKPADRKPCPRWCGWEHPGHVNDPHPPEGASFLIVPDGPISRARCANERHDFNPKPAGPSTEAPARKSWCGTETASSAGLCWMAVRNYYCTEACRAAGRPLHPAPQPIGRCSCAESLRLRAALEAIRDYAAASGYETAGDVRSANALNYLAFVARRALALEPEGNQ